MKAGSSTATSDNYWTESGRFPFLVQADGRLAGFGPRFDACSRLESSSCQDYLGVLRDAKFSQTGCGEGLQHSGYLTCSLASGRCGRLMTTSPRRVLEDCNQRLYERQVRRGDEEQQRVARAGSDIRQWPRAIGGASPALQQPTIRDDQRHIGPPSRRAECRRCRLVRGTARPTDRDCRCPTPRRYPPA